MQFRIGGNAVIMRQIVIPPSSFTCEPKYIHEECVQDGLPYVRHFHKTDLFVKFTTNTNLSKILENLLRRQSATDMHDIVARNYKLQLSNNRGDDHVYINFYGQW